MEMRVKEATYSWMKSSFCVDDPPSHLPTSPKGVVDVMEISRESTSGGRLRRWFDCPEQVKGDCSVCQSPFRADCWRLNVYILEYCC